LEGFKNQNQNPKALIIMEVFWHPPIID